MSFRVEGFATMRMSVEDVARSRDWYKAFWQLTPLEDFENFVSFKMEGSHFDIVLADAKSPVSHGGCVGYWLVDNLENAINHALKLGGKIYRGPLRVDEVQRTIVQIEDPFGNVFGLEGKHDAPIKRSAEKMR